MTRFTIELDDMRAAALKAAAAKHQTTAEYLLAAAADSFLAEEEAPVHLTVEDEEAIREGVAQLDGGEGVPHEHVVAELRAKYLG